MKYVIAGIVVCVVVGVFVGLVILGAARSCADERYELMLRKQWREDHQ